MLKIGELRKELAITNGKIFDDGGLNNQNLIKELVQLRSRKRNCWATNLCRLCFRRKEWQKSPQESVRISERIVDKITTFAQKDGKSFSVWQKLMELQKCKSYESRFIMR